MDDNTKQALNKACAEKDHDRFYELVGECTPDELATFMYGPDSHSFTRGLAGEPRTPHKKLKEHTLWAPYEKALIRKVQESN